MSPSSLSAAAKRSTLFDYKARRSDGTEVLGRAAAMGELELDRLLQSDGLLLVTAEPSRSSRGSATLRMPAHDLTAFTNQLATMIHAGLPLLQSLEHLVEHARSREARTVISSILKQIKAGASLSEALGAHPAVFPTTYVSMVKSGEMSSSLPEVLRRQAEYLEWVREVKGVTRQAMIYPAALALAVVALVVILITFLVPALVELFPGGEEDLPHQTQFVMGISDFMRAHWRGAVAGLAAGAVALGLALHTVRGRLVLSRALLRIPRLGELLRMLATARFATTAAALQQSGCEIVRTIEIAGHACGNTFLAERFGRVLERVRGGDSISEGMRAAGGIDPYLIQLTSVGENSGRLGECLDQLADSYNAEVPRVVKWALGLIEPLVLIVGGLIVGFLLLAAVLPIFKIYETLG